MHQHCLKCGHAPLPANPCFPAECPACGVILARAGLAPAPRKDVATHAGGDADGLVLLALAWGAAVLRLQRRRIARDVLVER